eukprot:360637-Chlamydomonas_euryale.AAC.2
MLASRPPRAALSIFPHGCMLVFTRPHSGHIDATELLLRYGADVRARSDGALVAAAFKGYAPIVRCLIAAGADVDAQSGRALEQVWGMCRGAGAAAVPGSRCGGCAGEQVRRLCLHPKT